MLFILLRDWVLGINRFKTTIMLLTIVTGYLLVGYLIIFKLASVLTTTEQQLFLFEIIGSIIYLTVLLLVTYAKGYNNNEKKNNRDRCTNGSN
jgi:hypothetical protein